MGNSSFAAIRGPLVDKNGIPTREMLRWLQEVEVKVRNTLNLVGEIAAATKIAGRTEGIGTTVTNLTSAGLLADADKVAADGASFARVTLNQRTGGDRGFNALDANNRLANSFRKTAVNVSSTPTATADLSNDGASTTIVIAASTHRFPPGNVSYNSGSVNPGSFGTWYVYADDPLYAGGAVTYQFSSNPPDQVAAEGRISFGAILTVSAAAKTGGGYSGGTTSGGGGGRGYRF